MTLVVDVGNSHTVVGVWKNAELNSTLRLTTDARRTADEWRLFFSAWLASGDKQDVINHVVVASVVPAANAAVRDAIVALGVNSPLWLTSASALNFTFDYPQRDTIGADRIADSIAAVHYFGKDCIVVDFGTAITFSILTGAVFQGGVIVPGITSSLDALFSATAKLPKIAFHRAERAIGKSTSESIEIGAYIGWRGMVREILAEIKRELPEGGARHKVVVTGGISESLDFAPDFFDVVDKNLTLKGLFLASTFAPPGGS